MDLASAFSVAKKVSSFDTSWHPCYTIPWYALYSEYIVWILVLWCCMHMFDSISYLPYGFLESCASLHNDMCLWNTAIIIYIEFSWLVQVIIVGYCLTDIMLAVHFSVDSCAWHIHIIKIISICTHMYTFANVLLLNDTAHGKYSGRNPAKVWVEILRKTPVGDRSNTYIIGYFPYQP